MDEKFRPYCAVYLFLLDGDEKLLMAKRENTGFQDGMYSVPSGHVEADESLTDAMIRESIEEIGVKPLDLEFVHLLYRDNKMGINSRTYVDVYFIARSYSGEIENKEPNKCSEVSWISLKDLPENTIPYIKEVLEKVLKKQNFSQAF